MKERDFQSEVIQDVRSIFPDATVIIPDPARQQGISDLILLIGDRWAALEVKRSEKAPKRPNQQYYIDKFGEITYASFVYPENKERVLNELQQTFQS